MKTLKSDQAVGVCGVETRAIKRRSWRIALAFLLCTLPRALAAAEPPKVGDKAPDFTLKTLDGQAVHLGELTAKGNVVLVVLRGWPGYQCPLCDVQVHDFIAAASGFADAKAQLVFVYPGPSSDLKAHAEEFQRLEGQEVAKGVSLRPRPGLHLRQFLQPSLGCTEGNGLSVHVRVGQDRQRSFCQNQSQPRRPDEGRGDS